MNDPGLDEPIANTADRVNSTYDDAQSISEQGLTRRKGKEKALKQRGDPEEGEAEKRRWFLFTAFPLIAGTLGPLANLFSVCALVQSWRIKIPSGERISDPKWLTALNSISLATALAANLVLLFNFAHRIRYVIAQPLTVTLWYISASLLIIPLCLIHDIASSTIHHTLSQSFHYGILSAVLYTLMSTLLLLHYIENIMKKRTRSDPFLSHLTMPQRTLMLQTISFTLYLALGAGVFAALEGWAFVDTVYWADYTLLTIGLGSDFPLKTSAGRGLLIPYAGGGLVIIGLVIGSVRGLVLEGAEERVERSQMRKEREKWIVRFREKEGHGKEKRGEGNEEDMERRKAEFEAMRNVRYRSKTVRRYTALGVSFFAFLVLWFIGALVFWFAESNQSWTYGTSLYFAYVSLLTIGYGDFVPQSNAGKPFFVLWSLIAVPTVTIFISNMGSTVVRWVEQGTLWLARWTVLPEKRHKANSGKGKRNTGDTDEEYHRGPRGIEEEGLRGEMEKIGERVEKAEAEHGEATGLPARLAREIRNLAKDVGRKPPRKYSWEEWSRRMKLLEEEDDNRSRRRDSGNGTSRDKIHDGNSDGDGENWGWLGEDGPLFSRMGETEWILGKLCERLEEVLVERVNREK